MIAHQLTIKESNYIRSTIMSIWDNLVDVNLPGSVNSIEQFFIEQDPHDKTVKFNRMYMTEQMELKEDFSRLESLEGNYSVHPQQIQKQVDKWKKQMY